MAFNPEIEKNPSTPSETDNISVMGNEQIVLEGELPLAGLGKI